MFRTVLARTTSVVRHATGRMSLSSQPEVATKSIRASYTAETDPRQHSLDQEGLYYTMPNDVYDRLFKMDGFNKYHSELFSYLQETAIMIRRPALEVMQLLEQTDFSKPVNRFVIYGRHGNGKTYTLNHILHYGLLKEFVLVHCGPLITHWFYDPQDTAPSDSRPGRLDLPMDAAMWLQHFRSRNASILPKLNLQSSQKYSWSLRETTEPGEPLTNIIDHGINRMKHSSDCLAVLLRELKMHANAGRCRLLFTCDNSNAFFNSTALLHADKREVDVDDITIARAFKKLFRNDWRNGAVVAVVDNRPYFNEKKGWVFVDRQDTPKHLLREEGFELLDPFVPIKVPKYTEKEIENCLNYYSEKKLLARAQSQTEAGRQEIKFLSGYYPMEVYKLSTML